MIERIDDNYPDYRVTVAGADSLTFAPLSRCGSIEDGVSFCMNNSGGWVISYQDLQKLGHIAYEARQRAGVTAATAVPVQPLMDEFEKLLIEYGNAQFNFGEWREEDETPYTEVQDKLLAARKALIAWVREHVATVDTKPQICTFGFLSAKQ